MTARKKRRLSLLTLTVALVAAAAALMLSAFRDSVVFFYAPSELQAKPIPEDRQVRVGGLVVPDSLERHGGGTVSFAVTDREAEVRVRYTGLLPDLFAEGEGTVVTGRVGADGVLHADTVLAKHDEDYMPPEVAEALKEQGSWKMDGPDDMTVE